MNYLLTLLLIGAAESAYGSSQCGVSSVQQDRIIHGADAQRGAWPWITSIQFNLTHFCGGTLVAPKWVLTACHCAEPMSELDADKFAMIEVKLGAHDHRVEEVSTQIRSLKKVILHPDYNKASKLVSDFALLELTEPVILNSRVNIPCFPEKDVYPPIGKECYLAGWGSISNPGKAHHTLQQVKLPVVETSKCKWQKESICVGKGFKSQPDGKQQPNACRGDSGGPLVCQKNDGTWQLDGVASYVYEYCKYYTGFAPVNKYLDWINKYIRD